ncbi:MAG: haloacid dehalogenase-like hydrolase [Lachnospiraceae bacterium]|nr:haloacid dehalogenase-like hydrolase [Lachnospiraceae bacterium]
MEKEKSKKVNFWKMLSLMLAIVLVASLSFNFKFVVNKNVKTLSTEQTTTIAENVNTSEKVLNATDELSLWTDTSKLKLELNDYMKSITNENSKDFIPVKNRIAVFDFDGTLFCETDPFYFEGRLFYHHIMEDEKYKDRASASEKEIAEKIRAMMEDGVLVKGLEFEYGQSLASSFKGMTIDELSDYVKNFKSKAAPSYEGMINGDAFYKPMLQVINFLQKNDFTIYLISGSDRQVLRQIVEGVIDIPKSQIIGSDESFVATNQNGENGLTYQFKQNDKVILGGDSIIQNLNMNKVAAIVREIGEQPVLSFGNSSGDYSMANYTITNNKYKSAAFMLCCDDLERENGNAKKAESMYKACEENGWTPVSMKNDWITIYGEGVVKKNK